MDRRPVAAFAAALAALASSAVPGLAIDDGGTTATIVLTASGSVSITAPDDSTPVNLASVPYGTGAGTVTWPSTPAADIATLGTTLNGLADASGQLGTMTVVDSRTGIVTGWTATVSWTDFALPSASGSTETIEAANLVYSSGAATASGLGALAPSLLPIASGGTLGTYVGLLQLTGTDTVTWNPTVYIDLQDEVAGTYTGVITHSVLAN